MITAGCGVVGARGLVRLRTCVRRATVAVVPMSVEEIEQLRRSKAIAPLSASHVDELLETAAELAHRQREINRVLASLTSRWPGVGAALNELSKLTKT